MLPASDTASEPPANTKRSTPGKRLQYCVNLAVKLTVPIGAAVATWLSLHFEDRASVRALLNQREQAETSLKATMFGQLVGPIVGPLKDGNAPTNPMQYSLLVRLLALNFNDDFEMGPLMQSADERLAGSGGSYSVGDIEAARGELRSVAHRVIDRQVARLWEDSRMSCAQGGPAEMTLFVLSKDLPAEQLEAFGVDHVSTHTYALDGPPDQLPSVVSPDCKDALKVTLSRPQWVNQTIEVQINRSSPPRCDEQNPMRCIEHQSYNFELTPFAFPFSDNTPLADGNRFAIFENDVTQFPAGGETIRIMRLRLRWFPEYYYPPTERPADPKHVEQTLGIGPLGRESN